MKTNRLLQISIVTCAVAVATTGLAQNPRQVPPVTQPGSQYSPKPGAQTQSGGSTLSDNDRNFMKKAAEGGMKEVEMGRMAEQQGKSADVKAFGQRMVTDHTKANNELMALAGRKGVQLSNKPPKVPKISGANFDKEYMADMVKDHEEDLAEFQREASNGNDPDVKAFAAKTAKTVQKHLDLAKADQAKLH